MWFIASLILFADSCLLCQRFDTWRVDFLFSSSHGRRARKKNRKQVNPDDFIERELFAVLCDMLLHSFRLAFVDRSIDGASYKNEGHRHAPPPPSPSPPPLPPLPPPNHRQLPGDLALLNKQVSDHYKTRSFGFSMVAALMFTPITINCERSGTNNCYRYVNVSN